MSKKIHQKNILISIFACLFFVIPLFQQNHVHTGFADVEENNTKDTARLISTNAKVTSNLSKNDDVDWYVFSISSKGYFNLSFEHELKQSNDTYWKIFLYDESGEIGIDGTDGYWSVSGNSNRTTSNYGVMNGTYYIKITSDKFTSDEYSIKINYTNESNWETENNNSPSKANTISTEKGINGVLTSYYDEDWFKFTLKANSNVTIALDHKLNPSKNVYWKISIHDENARTEIATDLNVLGNSNFISSNYLLPAGKYTIKIVCDYYSDETYCLRINVSSLEIFEKESGYNSSKYSSDTLSINKPIIGSVSRYYKEDWYSFSILKSQNISIVLTSMNDDTDFDSIDICLFAYDDTEIFHYRVDNKFKSKEFGSYRVDNDIYYIKISSQYNSTFMYSLCVTNNHEHKGTWILNNSPLCLSSGEETFICEECNYIEKRTVESLGHNYDNWTWIEESTLTKIGERLYKCSICGETKTVKDKSKVWILPTAIVGGILFTFGVINYIRIKRKHI